MVNTKISHRLRRPLLEQQQSIRLAYLGWSQPVLHAACDYLLEHYCRGTNWDLDRCILVLPGGLAGRRLTQLLAIRAKEKSLVLRPPLVVTMGELPELLYAAKLPFASDLEQTLAWTKVLRGADPEFLKPLLLEVPDANELRPWMDLARMLGKLHRELASDLVDFDDVSEEVSDPQEATRWRVLAKLQRGYLDELHAAGLWDVQSARRFAIDHSEVKTDKEIILIGAVDLNRAQRRFLGAIADSVQVLVGAPASYAAGFHADGTLLPEYWQNLEIDIATAQIHVRPTALDAAKELAIQLASLGDRYSVHDVTIGITDHAIVPVLQETLSSNEVELRYGPGTLVTQSPPMRLIDTIVEYITEGSIDSFNRLVRIPSVQRWLGQQESVLGVTPETLLTTLDRYQEATLIRSVNQPEWPTAEGREVFLQILERLEQLLKPLRVSKQSLEQWAGPLRSVIQSVYGREVVEVDSTVGHIYERASTEINAIVTRLQSIPSHLDVPVTLSEAHTWLVGQLESVQVPPIAHGNAIEMMGWLDLALDDAKVLFLTGMHDGVVPESVNGDAFLPNQLRSLLGLMDNARRYARDCYAMLTMLHTREHMEIILNHMSVDGDPQTPSRLLLAVDPDFLAARVQWLLAPKAIDPSTSVPTVWVPRRGQTNIPIPLPSKSVAIRDMAVTDFKKFDQCPYRYYLNRIEKAKAFEHEKLELDGGGFGDLVHRCLEMLEKHPAGSSTDAKYIADSLVEELQRLARLQFGVKPPPALQIQIEQAERRLRAFAEQQAVIAEEGWRIRHIEFTVTKQDGIQLDLGDHKSMTLHGRIDRIDENPDKGLWAVWDYKTGDSTTKPRENHLKQNKTWVDWQLPLYGQLITKLGILDLSKVVFGYILLPRNALDTRFVRADFSLEEHAAAIESAKGIARKVYEGEFWPPKYKGVSPFDDYNAITQHFVARKWEKEIADQESEQIQLQTVDMSGPSNTSDRKVPDNGAALSLAGDPVDPVGTRIDSRHASEMVVRRAATRWEPKRISLVEHHASGKPNPEWFTPKMILASAGTGKTFNLASRALRLLFTDQPLDSILATTFTRKAAGEILHRVLSWLAAAIEDTESLKQLQSILSPLVVDRETVKYQLGRLCAHLHRFRVSTLDSFYSQLARSFALELKLPPGWSLSDPYQYEQLKQEAISRMFEVMDRGALKSLVSQLSKGDASRSIRREIESVVSTGYDLFRRTTEEAWNLLHVPKGPSQEETEAALQALRNSQLQHKSYPKARDTVIASFEAQEWIDFLGSTLVQRADDDEPTYQRKELDPDAVKALRLLAKKAATEELASRKAQNEAAYRLLSNYHQQLHQVKTRRRTVTFDDIAERLSLWMREMVDLRKSASTSNSKVPLSPMEFTQEIDEDSMVDDLETSKEESKPSVSMESIAYRMDSPINHLLLDEFQDTSPVQWEIVKPFAEAIVANEVSKTSFFCVGDSKQAIYGWRGGVAEIFESVGEQIRLVQQEKLVKSYRSSPIVIDFVNNVFTQLDKHECYYSGDEADVDASDIQAVLDWTSRNFVPHETSRSALPGYVEFRNADVDKNTDPTGEESSYGLLEEVADRIAELHHANGSVEIGVLSRTNRDVVKMITLLRERGVDASQEGGNPLTDSAAVLLLLSAMRVANHPADTLAHFHVQNSPLKSYWSEETASIAEKLSTTIRSQIDAVGFGHTLGEWAKHLASECNERDQDRLLQLVQLGYRFDAMQVDSLFEFIEYVEQQKVAVPGVSKVRVMTIHQSKGLEFDAVFLPTLDQTIISRPPNFVAMYAERTKPPIGVIRYMNRDLQRYLDDSWKIAFREFANQQLAEALCVFYVALTRARNALYLYTSPSSSVKKRWGSVLHSIFATQDQKDQRGILIHSWGEAKWYEKVRPLEPHSNANESAESVGRDLDSITVRTIRLKKSDTGLRQLPWLRPSHVDTARVVSLADRWVGNDFSGAVIGKLVHRWFEEVKTWIEDFKPSKKRLKEIASQSLTQEEMVQIKLNEWVDRFIAYCEMPSIRSSLSKDRYRGWHSPRMLHLEVTHERRLLQVIDGQMLRGVIDRCVLGFDGDRVVRAEIIDFKTDSRPADMPIDDWIRSRVIHHGSQLRYYRRVICDQYQLDPCNVQLTLLLLSEDREVSVDSFPEASEGAVSV